MNGKNIIKLGKEISKKGYKSIIEYDVDDDSYSVLITKKIAYKSGFTWNEVEIELAKFSKELDRIEKIKRII